MFSNSIIVVPWDFSDRSQIALEFALERTSPENLRVVCVLEKPDAYRVGANVGELQEEQAREKCEAEFWEAIDKSRAPGLKFGAKFGDAATEIVGFADEVKAELILISTHGRTGISRLMLGSVAQKVSQIASCPVLLLPSSLQVESKLTKDSDVDIASDYGQWTAIIRQL